MKKQEITIYSETVNCPVVQIPWRKFPGIVIQGDSLKNLSVITNSIVERIRDVGDEELLGDVQELSQILSSYLECYERVLELNKIPLPYTSSP